MVSPERRSRGSREEVPRKFRDHRSLERSFWGGPRFRRTHASAPYSDSYLNIGVLVQEDRLWIADPKALNHILQKSGYLYAKPNNVQERTALLTDRGIIWAEGELSITISPFLLPVCSTIPQVTYTNVTGGQWLRHSAASRLEECYRISWILLPRHGNFICIRSRMLTQVTTDGRQVEWYNREQQVRTFSRFRCKRVVGKGRSRCVCPGLSVWWAVD